MILRKEEERRKIKEENEAYNSFLLVSVLLFHVLSSLLMVVCIPSTIQNGNKCDANLKEI